LWANYQNFISRDLSKYKIVYLYVDGVAERLRPGQRREPVLAAWGFSATGKRILLHLMAGLSAGGRTPWRKEYRHRCAADGNFPI